jgi:DNA-binding transcriptional MerR regulator
LRIGELSRRVGVTPEVLRAWERRYGILSPTRTDGGFRLYGEDDERRIRRMLQHLEQGLSAAEAARLARAEPPARPDPAAGTDDRNGTPTAAALGEQLRRALDEFDDADAHSVLAGGGTDAGTAETIGARWLNQDPVAAAASTAAPEADATA